MRIEPGALGRLLPPDRAHEEKYPHQASPLPMAPPVVETSLRLPDSLRKSYNQGSSSACVGYSACIQASIYAQGPDRRAEWFDGLELYHAAQQLDGEPVPHDGTYVRCGFQVMKERGPRELLPHQRVIEPEDGLSAYYWCRQADEVRDALAAGHVVVLGIDWYSGFDHPVKRNGEWWIGTAPDLGRVRGGHAICAARWSDKREAVQLTNSWGLGWPRAWLPVTVLSRLLGDGAEAGYGLPRSGGYSAPGGA